MLIGHLGADPEVRHLEQNQVVSNLRLATNRSYNNKAGEKVEETEWHRVVCWGKLAEITEQYLHKGSLVYIEGRLTTRQWQDKEGNERYTTEIRCDNLQMLGGKGDEMPGVDRPEYTQEQSSEPKKIDPAAGPEAPSVPNTNPPAQPQVTDDQADDLPF